MIELENVQVQMRDVYGCDTLMYTALHNAAATPANEPVEVYYFLTDPHYTDHDVTVRRDWIWIVLSILKAVEIYVLWTRGPPTLCWLSACPWFYLFCGAVLLQYLRLSRGYYTQNVYGQVDLLGGDLPTARKASGGIRKIVLGVPSNPRSHLLWKVLWMLGAVICSLSLVALYLVLQKADGVTLCIWFAFQTFWMAPRLAFYHQTEGPSIGLPTLANKVGDLSTEMRDRVLNLMLALSKYQIHVHPRASYSYQNDLQQLAMLKTLMAEGIEQSVPLPRTFVEDFRSQDKLEITVKTVIGDTLFTSAAWMYGSKLSAMDLYDTCLIAVLSGTQTSLIPGVRALSSTINIYGDVEGANRSLFSPKGSLNAGPSTVQWHYWIPVEDGYWLHFVSQDLRILGKRVVDLWSDTEVTRQLLVSGLNISLRSAEDLRDAVKLSITVGDILKKLTTGTRTEQK